MVASINGVEVNENLAHIAKTASEETWGAPCKKGIHIPKREEADATPIESSSAQPLKKQYDHREEISEYEYRRMQ